MVKLQEDLGVVTPAHHYYPPPDMGGYAIDSNFNRKLVEDKYGFRLQELNHNNHLCNSRDQGEDATSVSGHSNYKQRIDSMFDDSRSMVSEKSKHKNNNSLINNLLEEYHDQEDKSAKNNIQEKIEKMFEEISMNGFHKSNSFRNFKNSKNDINLKSDSNSHHFKVIYLGSRSLEDKNVSLINLQEPLRDLYLEHKKKNIVEPSNLLTISKEGLKININDSITLNPFPTIAVWASVKFSWRQSKTGTEYAFLPLIKDPDGIDKNMLYRELADSEKDLLDNNNDEKGTPPIFFVVMKNSQNKTLECHGFVCSSSEEAIVIAANLYQALMKKMKKRTDSKSDFTSSSETAATESEKEKSDNSEKPKDPGADGNRKKTPPPVPARPPRKVSKDKQQNEELISELKETLQEVKKQELRVQSRRGSVPNNIFSASAEPVSTLRRSVSERRDNGIESMEGDILTKVAIPRSRSFLNANGPLTRYSRRNKTNAHSDGEITSPLGFNELFNEFRQNEGLESMDDILNAIIDAEGMSFNDLKPIYKEFLLKLAVTLTKDELFQRSKNIMRRQKKKNRSRSFRKKTFVSATGLRKVFRKTASKLSKPKNTRPTTLEFTSVVFQSNRKHFETSTSSTCSSNAIKKEIRRRPSSRRRAVKKPERKINKKMSSTSEDSDCFIIRNGNESGGCPNRSSSGYFSCSECSYDSENCTCTSADKCYCTLGNKKNDKDKLSLSSCGRDTESCVDSEKCYCTEKDVVHLSDVKGICQTPHLHQTKTHNMNCPNYAKAEKMCKKHSPTILEQLKEQGFVASDSSLSRAASPSTAWRTNEEKLKRPKECLKTSRSLEFLQIRPQRQQPPERPPPPVISRPVNYVEGTRHFCYHGPEVAQPRRKEPTYRPRRHFSSMRARSPNVDLATSRVRNRVFSSMRAKSIHDDIMNHVLFPERNGSATSSLRFTRRMDVYNSFQSRRCVERQGSYIDLLNQIQTRFQNSYPQRTEIPQTGFSPILERPICQHDPTQIYVSSGGSDNFQKLDYDLFTASVKSETSESASNVSERKVLVVSARDPRGKVLYMGASSRGENVKDRLKDRNAANASEALSVKKSAEIAALFSDVYLKQKMGRAPTVREQKTNTRPNSYRLSNMENTLGYLP